MGELIITDRIIVEINGRQSGEHYYQIAMHLGNGAMALVARGPDGVRALPFDPADYLPEEHIVKEMFDHPEVYLGGSEVIQDYE